MASIDAVTFDLWQTLIVDSPEQGRPRMQARLDGVRKALQGEGFDVPEERLREASRKTYEACDAVRVNGRDVSFDEQVDIFLRNVDVGMAKRLSNGARAEVSRRYADSYLEHPPNVDEHAESVLRTLRDMGFKLALICNTGATPGVTQRVFLDRVGLGQYFETLTFSDEERLSKPASEIFRLTLERINAEPARTVHVGDHHRNDVAGAKGAGLRVIWLRRSDKAPEEYYSNVPTTGGEHQVQADAEVRDLGQVVPAIKGLL